MAVPTIQGRRLAMELRALRRAAGYTQEQVCEITGVNSTTLWRWERGDQRPYRRTLVQLLDLYGVGEQKKREVLELLKGGARQGWSRDFANLSREYAAYMSFEDEAEEVRNFQSLYIPGLLQTEDYARVVIKGMDPTLTSTEIDQRVEARMGRRQLLEKERPLRLWAVLDEAALRRPVGGQSVMKAQMNYISALLARPHVTVQVIPFHAGPHPGLQANFSYLQFAADVPGIVYLEHGSGDLFLETESALKKYSATFDRLMAMADSPERSAHVIATMWADQGGES
ncbi:helix-turn-helix domain-containing protein [Streptomyces sp. MS19]|uniref:helix-turn-helix domain-containing protein n=1 Tax=Streptomyces sp. MS19 TaxID=3385972 RepID=UPI0039A08597